MVHSRRSIKVHSPLLQPAQHFRGVALDDQLRIELAEVRLADQQDQRVIVQLACDRFHDRAWRHPQPPRRRWRGVGIISCTSIALSWSAAADASSYNIYKGTASGGEGSSPFQTGITATSFTETNLPPDITAYYWVTAVYGNAQSSPSNEAHATPAANNYTPVLSSFYSGIGDDAGPFGNDDLDPDNTVTISLPQSYPALTYEILTYPQHGTVRLVTENSSSKFIYSPDLTFIGVDRFTFKANDGHSDTNVASAVFESQRQPFYAYDDYAQGGAGLVDPYFSVLSNDLSGPIDTSFPAHWLEVTTTGTQTTSRGGHVTLYVDGRYDYVFPDANDDHLPDFSGIDTFKYKARNTISGVESDETTVRISMSNSGITEPLPPPSPFNADVRGYGTPATSYTKKTNRSQPISFSLASMALYNNSGGPVTYGGTGANQQSAHGGAVTITSTGSVTYSPASGFAGWDNFEYSITDSHGTTGPQKFWVFVRNVVPEAANLAVATAEDIPKSGTLTAKELSGEPFTFRVAIQPLHGTVNLNAQTGQFTYTPSPGFHGSDRFEYIGNDGIDDGGLGTVSISVDPIHLDLVVNGVGEDQEMVNGTIVRLNDNFDEMNTGQTLGFPDRDNAPGSSAVLNDPQLSSATVSLTGPAETAGISGVVKFDIPAGLKLYQRNADDSLTPLTAASALAISVNNSYPTPHLNLMVEGMSESQSLRDMGLAAHFVRDGIERATDEAKVTVIAADVDVDSDNDNDLNSADLSAKEDYLEEQNQPTSIEPGKLISVDNGDDDADGIPNFADGYDRDGVLNSPDDRNQVAGQRPLPDAFTPITLRIPDSADIESLGMSLRYAASNPASVSQFGGQYTAAPFVPGTYDSFGTFHPTGGMRLWTKEGVARTGRSVLTRNLSSTADDALGFYVPDNQNFSPVDLRRLGFSEETRTITLWAEGVLPSTQIGTSSIQIYLQQYGSGINWDLSDSARMTVGDVDLDVDSDNDNSGAPDRSAAEELAEQDLPGKAVVINDADRDNDGIVDFADGFNRDGTSGGADDFSTGATFVPMVISVPSWVNLSTAKIRLTYDASDPAQLQSVGDAWTPAYAPAPGTLRVWTLDADGAAHRSAAAANATSSPGNYVPSGEYTPAQLGITNSQRTVTLYIEAIRAAQTPVQKQVKLELSPTSVNNAPKYLFSDLVVVTPLQDFAPDAAMSGSVRLDDRSRAYQSSVYGNAADATLSQSVTTDYWFDPRGLTSKSIAPGGLVTQATYDGAGRMVTQSVGNGTTDLTRSQTSYDTAGNVTYVYDEQRKADGRVGGMLLGAAEGAAYGAGEGLVRGTLQTGSLTEGLEQAAEGAFLGGAIGGGVGALFHQVCFVAGTQVVVDVVEEDADVATPAATAELEATSGTATATKTRGYVTKPIEQIVARGGGEMGDGGGQYVLSRDQHDPNGPLLRSRVTRTYRRIAYHLQVLTVRGTDGNEQTIRVTDEHPFYLIGTGWAPVRSLAASDEVLSDVGKLTVVENSGEAHPEGVAVYNLEVERAHTYFARSDGSESQPVWVHNAGNEYHQGTFDFYEPAQPKAGRTTRVGAPRNQHADWRAWRDSWDDFGYGEILSPENRSLIADNLRPVVDEAWVKVFPGDAHLIGEIISPHHIGGYPITIPQPVTRHLEAHMPGGFRYNPGGPGRTG